MEILKGNPERPLQIQVLLTTKLQLRLLRPKEPHKRGFHFYLIVENQILEY